MNKNNDYLGMVAHAYNLSAPEAEANWRKDKEL
jgi:hypothetical protein